MKGRDKGEETTSCQPTKSATFIVRILRTDNGTWQGSVGHVQSGEIYTFKSCLEMLRLIDELVGTSTEEEKGARRYGGRSSTVSWP
ncbi:MAG: hypothetical protein GX322_00795 [Firmicutes bacterium]|nr:hypothetical protein [Bacillota bacterium]